MSSAVGVRLDQTGIHGEAFTADHALPDASRDNVLEHDPQQIAVSEPAVTVLGESRVLRRAVRQIEPAKPSIAQVEMNLFAQAPFGSDAVDIPQQQHADYQFRIHRRPMEL